VKTRQGFVSNSSTSSFVVAVNDDSSTSITLTVKINLADYGQLLKSQKELDEYIVDEYCCGATLEEFLDDDSWIKEKYDAALNAIESGKVVIWGSFTNECSEPEEALLCSKGLRGFVNDKKVEIIHSEGGY